MVILGVSIIQEKNSGSINTKNKRITVADLPKKRKENISKALMQIGLVTTKVFGKICNFFSLKNERLTIRLLLLTKK